MKFSQANKFFVDVETSGSDLWRHSIIQLAYIVTDSDLKELGRKNCFLQLEQGAWWDEKAEEVHQINQSRLVNFKTSISVLNEFVAEMQLFKPLHFINHASSIKWFRDDTKEWVPAHFDWNFMLWWFTKQNKRGEFYDIFPFRPHTTILPSAQQAATRYGVSGQGLAACASFLCIDNSSHHDALNDVKILLEIYKYQNKGMFDGREAQQKQGGKLREGNSEEVFFGIPKSS